MTNAEAVELSVKLGVPVKSHSSSLNEAYADMVRRRAIREGLTRPEQPEEPKAAKKAPAKKGREGGDGRPPPGRLNGARNRSPPPPPSRSAAPVREAVPPVVEPVTRAATVAIPIGTEPTSCRPPSAAEAPVECRLHAPTAVGRADHQPRRAAHEADPAVAPEPAPGAAAEREPEPAVAANSDPPPASGHRTVGGRAR